MATNPFTPEEDALIASSGYDELPAVCERLGRSRSVVGKRRKRLLGIGGSTPPAVYKRRHRPTHNGARSRITQRGGSLDRFARPSWFDEDLRAMTKGAL